VLFTSEEFPVAMQLAFASVGENHRESARASLLFLTYLITKSENQLQLYKTPIDQAIESHCGALFQTLLLSLASTSPSTLYSHLGNLLYALLNVYGKKIYPLFHQVLNANENTFEALGENDKTKLFNAWTMYVNKLNSMLNILNIYIYK